MGTSCGATWRSSHQPSAATGLLCDRRSQVPEDREGQVADAELVQVWLLQREIQVSLVKVWVMLDVAPVRCLAVMLSRKNERAKASVRVYALQLLAQRQGVLAAVTEQLL